MLSPVLALLAATAAPPDGAALWYVLSTGKGAPIGYASERIERTAAGRVRISERQVRLKEGLEGTTTVSSETFVEEAQDGHVIAVRKYDRTGRAWRRYDAAIRGGEAVITVENPADKRIVRVALPAGVRFDAGEGLLRRALPAPGHPLAFDAFDIATTRVDRVTIERVAGVEAGGAGAVLLRKRWDHGALTGLVRLTVDTNGGIIETVQPGFGTELRSRLADRETALAPRPAYRPLGDALVKSPVRIPAAAMKGHIRFAFAYRDGIAFELPQTGEQRVSAGADGVTVDVCGDCGPGLSTDEAFLADARRATPWLQSDAAEIRHMAAPIAHLRGVSEARKMEMLREKARPYLEQVDFTGHYSALETIARRAGDCTEASVLLAALGRAAGIPTRVVNGLVYSRFQYHGVSNVFMPHSWTLAYVDGAWRSFDLALDAFDSTHVALTVGDGDARSVAAASQLAGLLEWKAVSEIRTRPAP